MGSISGGATRVRSSAGTPGPAKSKTTRSFAAWVPIVVLILVALDLAVANRWMVVCAPAGQWENESKLAQAIEAHKNSRDGVVIEEALSLPTRVYRHSIWMPPEWKERGSPGRLTDAVRWDRDTLWPKHNLPQRISMAEVHGTMMPYDYQAFLWHVRRRATSREGRITLDPDGLGAVNVRYAILHGSSVPRGATVVTTPPTGGALYFPTRLEVKILLRGARLSIQT